MLRPPRRPASLLPALVLALAGALVAPGPATATGAALAPVSPEDGPAAAAQEALATAEDALAGPAGDPAAGSPDASLALLDLALAAADLEGDDRARARRLLARPTDGPAAELGGGYTTDDVERACDDDLCVHHVTTTADAATGTFARRALEVMGEVRSHHVDELGLRAPVPDAGTAAKGGDARFDVYLADIGGSGLYGFCSPEAAEGPQRRVRPSYCVLDNDYAPDEFGRRQTPDDNLRVTAAHEFLHAVQYAYDAGEDTWLLESTATWVEERFADDVDDNRQFLADGQVGRPRVPLDRHTGAYGNWAFVEHLTTRFGVDLVRETLEAAAAPLDGSPGGGLSSVPALTTALAGRGGDLREAYARFAADNLAPGRSPYYPEGAAWGLRAPVARQETLRPSHRAVRFEAEPAHLSSTSLGLHSRGLPAGTRLRLAVDGPPGAAQPAVVVTTRRADGTLGRRYVPLTGPAGTATVRTDVTSSRVLGVTVTLVSASPRREDDGRRFVVEARALR
ncbi:MXAN_6640 family putative metalloprotease [uncultured Nocardioides sp.]|uniref:MXAN_6640 family putative metalloprotease n=1 Tax=uncultured Nocardioides sp. TaxID=198441 RepID=UPI00263595D2|nr:MXAN_6640 family putative metalloprotease [uncultured Nocardioides sp.]